MLHHLQTWSISEYDTFSKRKLRNENSETEIAWRTISDWLEADAVAASQLIVRSAISFLSDAVDKAVDKVIIDVYCTVKIVVH